MARIPLRRRDGSIRAYAIVDDADYAELAQHRWHLTPYGYAARDIGGRAHKRKIYMHRQIAGLDFGDPREADHDNLNRLDDRRSNLIVVAKRGNRQNVRANRGSTSAYRGVSWVAKRGKWLAQAKVDGRAAFIGHFDSELEAARAAAAVRAAFMPDSAEGRAAA
jgi:hypothetical protein